MKKTILAIAILIGISAIVNAQTSTTTTTTTTTTKKVSKEKKMKDGE